HPTRPTRPTTWRCYRTFADRRRSWWMPTAPSSDSALSSSSATRLLAVRGSARRRAGAAAFPLVPAVGASARAVVVDGAVVVGEFDALFSSVIVPRSLTRPTEALRIDAMRDSSDAVVVTPPPSVASTPFLFAFAIWIAWAFGYTNSSPVRSPG